MNNKFIVKEDAEGELYIELPDELMEQMGWGRRHRTCVDRI